jgi:hypothetical protein
MAVGWRRRTHSSPSARIQHRFWRKYDDTIYESVYAQSLFTGEGIHEDGNLQPFFETADKVNFIKGMNSKKLNPYDLANLGTPDQKVGYRLGEISAKCNF